MGITTSKEQADSSPHVWKGSGPPTLSQDFTGSLQKSSENDESRAQQTELRIQSLVAQELKKLSAQADSALKDTFSHTSSPSSSSSSTTSSLTSILPSSLSSSKQPSENSQQSVSKEVAALRTKLESRKQVRDLPKSLEDARGQVVRCLRENDRRPLDCWEEVEAFKVEVKRLEKGWVDKVVS